MAQKEVWGLEKPQSLLSNANKKCPFGVKLCQQQVMRYGTDQVGWVGSGGWVNHGSESRVSLGRWFGGLLVGVLAVLVFN